MGYHAWEVKWIREATSTFNDETTNAEKNVVWGGLQQKINEYRTANGEQQVSVAQLQTALRNHKAETKNQGFELLPFSLPSTAELASETCSQLLRCVHLLRLRSSLTVCFA